MSVVDVEQLLSDHQRPVIDVRSPGEFLRGHVPGAHNVPLFDDEERAEVGTLYKNQGRSVAIERGFQIANSKIEDFFQEIARRTDHASFIVHCWRGGMRSQAVAWLCSDCGLEPSVLEGGYKQFRRQAHGCFEQPRNVILLGGPTGTGKTQILQSLHEAGEQVIDLEALANHRGSAFGSIPGVDQPTVEQFENNLFLQLRTLDSEQPVWIEAESQAIGRVRVPHPFWLVMSQAPMVYVDATRESRIEFLIEQYGQLPASQLESAALRLKKRLGGARLKEALDALTTSDLAKFCHIVLDYYDRTYTAGLQQRPPDSVQRLELAAPGDPGSVSDLVNLARLHARPSSEAVGNASASIE